MTGSLSGVSGAATVQALSGAADPLASAPSGTSGTDSATSSAASGASSSSGTPSNSMTVSGMDTFLQLLVAQMRDQDPMSPMDNQAFVTELAQFNQVEQMLGLKEVAQAQLSSQQAVEGIALMGRTVTYVVHGIGDAPDTTKQGAVTGVGMAGGNVQITVGTDQVPLGSVTAVA